MGGTSYSANVLTARLTKARKTNSDVFAHSALALKSGKMHVHEDLDPSKKNKAGVIIRESRDSQEHPNSLGIAVIFDVTGSMRKVPRAFIERLNGLMGLLIKKGYVPHPQLLFGAVGDATGDKVPLQIGQFESGNELDDSLTKIVLEGNGQTNLRESYELAMYFLARYASMDCLEKRGKKGYCFLIGDENPFSRVSKKEVDSIIKDPIEEDIDLPAVIRQLEEKFNVFWITPSGTRYWTDEKIVNYNRDLWDQRYIRLENPEDVCELIATTIGINEGYDPDQVVRDLLEMGADKNSVKRASAAIVPYASTALAKGNVSGGKLETEQTASVARL
jgi:hypothetical protein